jgi:hypothetical protein
MKIISLVFILCLLSQSFAITSITFSGNVSNADGVTSGEWDFRETVVWDIPINLGIVSYTLAGYASAGITVTGSGNGVNGSAQANGDLIVGAVKFFSGTVPVSFLGYINAQLNVNKVGSLQGTDVTTFNYSSASGFILTTYRSLTEQDPSGNVVRTLNLKDLVWSVTSGNSTDGYLHYITLAASNPLFVNPPILMSGESISMTFLISDILGQVTIGANVINVTPKTLESILQVNSWSYQSAANNLVFTCGVGTGSATGDSAGTVTLASGSGDSQVYANFDGHVDISGSLKLATITKISTTNFTLVTDDASIQAQANSVYNGNFNLAVVTVAFPAGAESINYDPSQGAGQPILYSQPTGTNSASTLLAVLLLAIIVMLI